MKKVLLSLMLLHNISNFNKQEEMLRPIFMVMEAFVKLPYKFKATK